MKKSIEIMETRESGLQYFSIYEVKAVKNDGEVIVYDRYLKEEKANEAKDFIMEVLSDLYSTAYVRNQIVWIS